MISSEEQGPGKIVYRGDAKKLTSFGRNGRPRSASTPKRRSGRNAIYFQTTQMPPSTANRAPSAPREPNLAAFSCQRAPRSIRAPASCRTTGSASELKRERSAAFANLKRKCEEDCRVVFWVTDTKWRCATRTSSTARWRPILWIAEG